MSFHSLGILQNPESEIWWNSKYITGSINILKTVEEISLWNYGIRNGIDIQIEDNSSPGLLWLLRNQKDIKIEKIPIKNSAPIIFTTGKNNLYLEKTYRGQKMSYSASPVWIQ